MSNLNELKKSCNDPNLKDYIKNIKKYFNEKNEIDLNKDYSVSDFAQIHDSLSNFKHYLEDLALNDAKNFTYNDLKALYELVNNIFPKLKDFYQHLRTHINKDEQPPEFRTDFRTLLGSGNLSDYLDTRLLIFELIEKAELHKFELTRQMKQKETPLPSISPHETIPSSKRTTTDLNIDKINFIITSSNNLLIKDSNDLLKYVNQRYEILSTEEKNAVENPSLRQKTGAVLNLLIQQIHVPQQNIFQRFQQEISDWLKSKLAQQPLFSRAKVSRDAKQDLQTTAETSHTPTFTFKP